MSQNNSPDPHSGTEEPILLLKDLEQETSPAFLSNVRNKIHRRLTALQMLAFSWKFPSTVLFELGSVATHILTSFNSRTGRRRR